MREKSGVENTWPRDLHHEENSHVREESQAQPFQVRDITAIGDEDLQAEAKQAKS